MFLRGKHHTAVKACPQTIFIFHQNRCVHIYIFPRKRADRLNFFRLLSKHTQNQAAAVDAQIIGTASQSFPAHADIFLSIVRCNQGRLHVAHFSDGSVFQLFVNLSDIRAVLVGKSLHQKNLLLPGCLKHSLGLLRRGSQRLFAQNMLLCL